MNPTTCLLMSTAALLALAPAAQAITVVTESQDDLLVGCKSCLIDSDNLRCRTGHDRGDCYIQVGSFEFCVILYDDGNPCEPEPGTL